MKIPEFNLCANLREHLRLMHYSLARYEAHGSIASYKNAEHHACIVRTHLPKELQNLLMQDLAALHLIIKSMRSRKRYRD